MDKSLTCAIVCPPEYHVSNISDPFNEEFDSQQAEKEINDQLKKTLAITENATNLKQVDLIVLPEDIHQIRHLWRALDAPNLIKKFAEPVPGATTYKVSRIARKNKKNIVMTLYERSGHKIFNTTIFINKRGKIKAKYRKIHLAPGENWLVSPGKSFTVFKSERGIIGFACGEDYLFPETGCVLARLGAEIVIIPSRYPIPELILSCRSYELGYITIMANRTDSFLIDQAGRVLAQSSGRMDYLLTTEFKAESFLQEDRDELDSILMDTKNRRKRLSSLRCPQAYKVLAKKSWPESSKFSDYNIESTKKKSFEHLEPLWTRGEFNLPHWEM